MRHYFHILFLLFICGKADAQDITEITPDQFSNTGELQLDLRGEWLFREGNNSEWAVKELDTSGWIPLKPRALSTTQADKTGRLEGWFRFRFKVSPELNNTTLYYYRRSLDAAKVYLNGDLLHEFGKIAPNKESYHAYIDNHKLPIPITFSSDSINTIAIHTVDYTALFPARLRGQITGPNSFFALGTSQYFNTREEYWRNDPVFKAIWITTGVLLFLLFWFLWFLNRSEKNIRLIAMASTFALLCPIAMLFFDKGNVSFEGFLFGAGFFFLSIFVYLSYLPVTLSYIFTNHISKWLKYIVYGIVVLGLFNVTIYWEIIPMLIAVTVSGVLNLYFIVRYWQGLKGAQWALVVGILTTKFSILFLVILAYYNIIGNGYVSVKMMNWTTTGAFLAFPLSMLVYVGIRFKEIIGEIQTKAAQLLQVSEEKQVILSSQNQILEEKVEIRTQELRQAKDQVEKSLENLKNTQNQLIQAEKMASLGELTAGIAHEIQNPLNFVNNFSEVNNELIDEIEEELEVGDIEEVKTILDDLKKNLDKISHHGKRADSIVKGMLLHSRTSKGEKVLTDINALCDEFLRLSYHGLRAKNRNFNSEFEMDFDESIPDIEVVPQDIGRVLLNLFNNAFQAVSDNQTSDLLSPKNEKQKTKSGQRSAENPKVTVTTKNLGNKIEISVIDNGPGIPDNIKDKIFQPFFTTKPTGQGTGLGLSLAYDIIKAHGGEIKVNSDIEKGTVFTIEIPITRNADL